MSGPENFRGIDYQVTYSLYVTLDALRGAIDDVSSIHFESLDEDEEDINLIDGAGAVTCIQVKKRNEGYHWTPSAVREIFSKFSKKDSGDVREFLFVTNSAGNLDVVDLKKRLAGGGAIPDEIVAAFKPVSMSVDDFLGLLKKTKILTRHFPSDDDEHPASLLERRVKEMLCEHPFQFEGDVDAIFESLWKCVFDLSKKAKRVTIDELRELCENIGLLLISEPWLSFPEASCHIKRTNDANYLRDQLKRRNLVVIYGLSGVGKTSFAAEVAKSLLAEGARVFWCSFNGLVDINNFLGVFAGFLSSQGEQRYAQEIRQAERADLAKIIARVLGSRDLFLFLDGVNNLSQDVRLLLSNVFSLFLSKSALGRVVLTSTEIPDFYSKLKGNSDLVVEYPLAGLNKNECRELLEINGIDVDEIEFGEFVKAVSGHPLSIALYCQLCKEGAADGVKIAQIGNKTIEAAQEHIIRYAVENLPEQERMGVFQLCVIPYQFTADDIDGFVSCQVPVRVMLRSLASKNLLTSDGATFSVHDLIRSSCLSLMTQGEIRSKNRLIADLTRKRLENKSRQMQAILYDDGFKWAYHEERSPERGGVFEKLCELSNEELDALWAVDRFGFPFDYESGDLSHSRGLVGKLQSNRLIRKYSGRRNPASGDKKYEAVGLRGTFENIFLVYLCISRGASNHLGYIDKHRPNYAYEEQCHVVCPWEHCVELYPLPPITREDHVKHLDFIRRQFEMGAYDDKPQEIKNFLLRELEEGVPEDAPEMPDAEMEAKKCPLFGHCCPGGEEQAKLCREAPSEEE